MRVITVCDHDSCTIRILLDVHVLGSGCSTLGLRKRLGFAKMEAKLFAVLKNANLAYSSWGNRLVHCSATCIQLKVLKEDRNVLRGQIFHGSLITACDDSRSGTPLWHP